MATFHQDNGHYYVAVKGAPEAVLDACSRILTKEGEKELSDDVRRQWSEQNEQMAEEGLRVLAVASKTVNQQKAEPYQDQTLVALMGMADPPREEVQDAIKACQEALRLSERYKWATGTPQLNRA